MLVKSTLSGNSNEDITEFAGSDLAVSIDGEYSIGKQFAVSFTPDDEYEFLYWETDFNNISFADKNQKNTNIIINSANPGGTTKIWPKTIEKLKVTDLKIYNASDLTTPSNSDSNGAYAKDSVIEIEFNNAPSDKINIRN